MAGKRISPLDFGQPYPALFIRVLPEWRDAKALPVGHALRTSNNHWLLRATENTIQDFFVYGKFIDMVDLNTEGEVTSFWSQYLTTFLHIEQDKRLPGEMAEDLVSRARQNAQIYTDETTARGARNGAWHEWGPCEACATRKNYIRLFADRDLYRCRHCGRWAELITETDRDMRRHRSDFDWEKALPLIDGRWMKPIETEVVRDIILEKTRGKKKESLETRRQLQAQAERSFRLPRPVAIADTLPLAEQLFQRLGMKFTPERRALTDGTQVAEDKSGLKVAWADITPDPYSTDDVIGKGPHNQCARIEIPPCSIEFRIFANRLDAFDVSGPVEEVRKVAALIKEIWS